MIQTKNELYSILQSTQDEIQQILNNIHEHYRPHIQPKIKFGKYQIDKKQQIKKRYLLIPSPILKKIQQQITNFLQKKPLPPYMYGCIAGRNHIQNARQHINQKYFLTADLKNFFSNINHQQVFQLFRRYNCPIEIAKILTKLTTYKKTLPQGSPCSPVIANHIFLPAAKELNTLSYNSGICFTCFLDDLSFSSQYDFKNLVPEFLNIIMRNGFFPSQNKIHYRTGSCEITGLIVCKNKLSVIPAMLRESKSNACLRVYVESINKLNFK